MCSFVRLNVDAFVEFISSNRLWNPASVQGGRSALYVLCHGEMWRFQGFMLMLDAHTVPEICRSDYAINLQGLKRAAFLKGWDMCCLHNSCNPLELLSVPLLFSCLVTSLFHL
jgi:hypothetical protein